MSRHCRHSPGILFLLVTNFCFSQHDRKFVGQLIPENGDAKLVNNLSVRLVDKGSGTTGTDGIFRIGIDDNAASVSLQLVNSNLHIIYPVDGRISVPKDTSEVVQFIVGDSPKDILTKAVAKSNNEIKSRLSQLGVKQDGIDQTLAAFRDEIQRMTNIKLEDLKDQIALASRREEFYPELSSAINNYINEAKDLKDAFKFTASHAFEDAQALKLLNDAIASYNDVYKDINSKYSGYEKKVADLWESESKATEIRAFFDYALGELHSANIFTLNLKVNDINKYFRGDMKNSEKRSFKETILHEIESTVLQLERRLEELDKKAQVILNKLAV